MHTDDFEPFRLSSLQTGRLLNERYEIVERIGSGAMSTVFKARDRELKGASVVLKFLRSDLVHDEKQIERFRNEALVMRELTHPNIVRVYEFGSWGSELYFISMEYVEGTSLRALLDEQRGSGLAPEHAQEVLLEVARGMAHAHSRHVVHRDLKPDNVLINKQGEVKITDFGLAKTTLLAENLTEPGETVGTPHYMAPEQLCGAELDARSDIYAFGITCYELLTGRKPFPEDNYLKLAARHLNEPLPKLNVPAIPSWWNAFIAQCTAKDPTQRFQSFDDIQHLLEGRRATMLGWKLGRILRGKALALSCVIPAILAILFLVAVLISRVSLPFRVMVGAALLRSEAATGWSLPALESLLLGSTLAEHAAVDHEALLKAVAERRHEALQIMVRAGVGAGAKDSSGRSALTLAVLSGDPIAVRILAGGPTAQIDAQDKKGRTALMHAVLAKRTDMVETLLRTNASVTALDEAGNSALIHAAATDEPELVQQLLTYGAASVINHRNKQGKSALSIAQQRKSMQISKLLLESGAARR